MNHSQFEETSSYSSLNFLITCIAINLMLIVCFGINPIEKSERHGRLHTSRLYADEQDWRGGMSEGHLHWVFSSLSFLRLWAILVEIRCIEYGEWLSRRHSGSLMANNSAISRRMK